MSDNIATLKENVDPTNDFKGKGKASAQPETKDVSMDTEDSSSEDEVEEVFELLILYKPMLIFFRLPTLVRFNSSSPYASFLLTSGR